MLVDNALLLRRRHGMKPPRERGRPARTTLAQPHPSPPPGSTGNGSRRLLRPTPGRRRRQGGRVPHHGETERPPNAENAGETPALPEGRLLPSFLLREEALPLPMRQCRPAWCAFVVLRVSSWILFFRLFQASLRVPDQEVRPFATSATKAAARRRSSSMLPESSSF